MVLEPIYVSLYGLKETSQITNAIDKVLHHILHSKGAEFTKELLKFAGKIAFQTSLDWDKDESEDVIFESTLDSLSVFATKDQPVVKSKLIVFDDLERCLIDMKLQLGYINNFVEDYSELYGEVSDYLSQKNESFMLPLLATYIVCYCEIRGEYQDLLADCNFGYFAGLIGDKTAKNRISELQGKYRVLSEKYEFEILDSNHIPQIVRTIQTGFSIKDYVIDILQLKHHGILPFSTLSFQIWILFRLWLQSVSR